MRVEDRRAACPRWLSDGRLLVSLVADDDSTLAVVDPGTGATDEVLPIRLGTPSCAAPAGPDHVVHPRAIGEPYGPEGSEVVRTRLDGTDEEVVGRVPGGCWPLDVSADVDGGQLAAGVVCEDARLTGLYLGAMTDDLHQVVGENEGPEPEHAFVASHPAWSGDGTFVAFDRGDQRGDRPVVSLWRVAPDDRGASELEPAPSALAAFSPPPGGDRD